MVLTGGAAAAGVPGVTGTGPPDAGLGGFPQRVAGRAILTGDSGLAGVVGGVLPGRDDRLHPRRGVDSASEEATREISAAAAVVTRLLGSSGGVTTAPHGARAPRMQGLNRVALAAAAAAAERAAAAAVAAAAEPRSTAAAAASSGDVVASGEAATTAAAVAATGAGAPASATFVSAARAGGSGGGIFNACNAAVSPEAPTPDVSVSALATSPRYAVVPASAAGDSTSGFPAAPALLPFLVEVEVAAGSGSTEGDCLRNIRRPLAFKTSGVVSSIMMRFLVSPAAFAAERSIAFSLWKLLISTRSAGPKKRGKDFIGISS